MDAMLNNALARAILLLAAGTVMDLLVGDPQWLWHPVQGIGICITYFEKIFRKIFPKTKMGELLAGGFMVMAVLATVLLVVRLLVKAAYRVHVITGFLVELYLYESALAARSLQVESRKVKQALECKGLTAGRTAVAMIVGRDTDSLSEEGVIKATVETVAENTSDGIIAPMLFLAIFGSAGGWFYKAANTMDSMVGYKNDRYLYFGTVAARLDDVLNLIPARLAAFFMICASAVLFMHPKRAYQIYHRDRFKHASPNSAHTEAVMAGALGIQLAGDTSYFGKVVKKETIGDPLRHIEREDIHRSACLMYGTEAVGFLFCIGVLLLRFLVIAQR